MSSLSSKALEIAITQIGQDEKPHGSNWGEPVKTYLHSVGIDFPASWCMAYVYWCFNQAALSLTLPNPLVKTGGVLRAYNEATNAHSGMPQPGAIFILDFGHGLGHTGIVEKFDETFIYTVEGNTNDTGSREGIEVCRRKRSRQSVKGYLVY